MRRDDEDETLFIEAQTTTSNLPPRAKRRRKANKDAYVMVPLWWLEQATKATRSPQTFVAVWLLYLSWKAKSPTFPVPNSQLEGRGADRQAKRRALASLEAAGLITVDRRDRKTPVVTLLVL